MFSRKFDALVENLRLLPGVGPKSAQRMALHLVAHKKQEGIRLGETLIDTLEHVQLCSRCQFLSDDDVCLICQSPNRDQTVMCVVESAADVMAIEQTGSFKGLYFVLGGRISPIDGIGPNELGIPMLVARLQNEKIQELILATNPTIEGQTTAHFIQEAASHLPLKITRLAQGVPMGGELEYLDSNTLNQALKQRLSVR